MFRKCRTLPRSQFGDGPGRHFCRCGQSGFPVNPRGEACPVPVALSLNRILHPLPPLRLHPTSKGTSGYTLKWKPALLQFPPACQGHSFFQALEASAEGILTPLLLSHLTSHLLVNSAAFTSSSLTTPLTSTAASWSKPSLFLAWVFALANLLLHGSPSSLPCHPGLFTTHQPSNT